MTGDENYNKDVLAVPHQRRMAADEELCSCRSAADYTDDDSLPRQGYRLPPVRSPAQRPLLDGDYDTRADL